MTSATAHSKTQCQPVGGTIETGLNRLNSILTKLLDSSPDRSSWKFILMNTAYTDIAGDPEPDPYAYPRVYNAADMDDGWYGVYQEEPDHRLCYWYIVNHHVYTFMSHIGPCATTADIMAAIYLKSREPHVKMYKARNCTIPLFTENALKALYP